MIKYSFVIIAFNEEKGIGSTISSILKQEGLNNFEIIVVNDASSDKTDQVVRDLSRHHKEIKLVNNKISGGRGFSRNKGVTVSQGKFIAFVDADIILPRNWLKICSKEIKSFDAVGGIAVPDGDVMYIYRMLSLRPKAVKHTTSITGNNGLFKSEVLKKIGINKSLRDGEDVDLTWRMEKGGYKVKSIANLTCLHQENKTFFRSVKWMFQQGKGANRLFLKYKKFRLPDIAFLGFIITLITAIILLMYFPLAILLPFIYCLTIAFILVRIKFQFSKNELLLAIYASSIQSTMIASYFFGRSGLINL
jgi:glycosyltransferase involved in cell wall biosynthesis